MLCSRLRPVHPAFVNDGLWISASSFFFVSLGRAQITGCPKRTRNRPIPRLNEALLWNRLETSSKLIESSLGNVFLGLASFLTCTAGGGATGFGAGFAATAAAVGLGGTETFGSCGAAATLFCAPGGGPVTAAVALCSGAAFRNRDWKFS